MSLSVQIRNIGETDIDLIFQGLLSYDIKKPRAYVERCWRENITGERTSFLALCDGAFIGWAHLVYKSGYSFFSENCIPEIQNFDVIPPYRRRGVGSDEGVTTTPSLTEELLPDNEVY